MKQLLTLLPHCRYDLADVLEAAMAHVMRAELTIHNLPGWLALAAAHELQPAIDRCLAFARDDENLHDILECVFSTPPSTRMLIVRVPEA